MRAPDWIRARNGEAYTRYARARLSPTWAGASELWAARRALHETPLAREILATQRSDGGWDSDPEQWYRSTPRTVWTLLDYGFTTADEPVARAVTHLQSLQRADGSFATEEPEAIPYDEAYNAGCIRALVAAGLREHPVTRAAAERLLAARRHDGGWSTLPPWMRQAGAAPVDPEPSCPICTNLAVRALGAAIDLPAGLRDELLGTSLQVASKGPADVRAAQLRERLGFMADQALRAGDPRVDACIEQLLACRGADGRTPDHESPGDYVPSELAETLARNLLWRLGAPGLV